MRGMLNLAAVAAAKSKPAPVVIEISDDENASPETAPPVASIVDPESRVEPEIVATSAGPREMKLLALYGRYSQRMLRIIPSAGLEAKEMEAIVEVIQSINKGSMKLLRLIKRFESREQI